MSCHDCTPTHCHCGDHLRGFGQALIPQRLLTQLCYRLTRAEQPWLKNALIRHFVRAFKVDLSEAVEQNPEAYPHFNAFFTRALKQGARPIAAGHQIACPVDGTISQIGRADADVLLQAKDRTFSLTALLGGDVHRAQPFIGGHYATIYLSPRNYHRIHMPVAGQLREMVHIPGDLWSVSALSTRTISNLFARNERVVTIFDTVYGPMALVLVGALNVASIETVWAGAITPPLGKKVQRWAYPTTGEGACTVEKGAEMGRFNMGSTVILLFGPEKVDWEKALGTDVAVQMGQAMA